MSPILLCLRILPLIMILLVPAGTMAASSSDVISDLMCPCGTCDEPLITCECPESGQYRAQIVDMVKDGYNRDQIIQDFIGRFGTSVLADKTPSSDTLMFSMERRTIGFLLLGASLLLVAFMLGTYHGLQSPLRSYVRKSGGGKGRPARKKKTAVSKSRGAERPPDEMLDDYEYN